MLVKVACWSKYRKKKFTNEKTICNSAHLNNAGSDVDKYLKIATDAAAKRNAILNAEWDAEEAAREAREALKEAKDAAARAKELRQQLEAGNIIHISNTKSNNITDEIERIKRESVFKEEKVLAARAESKRLAAVAAKKAYEELKMALEQEKSEEHTPAEDIREDSDKVIDDESGDDEVINDKIIERESFGTGEHSSTIE